MTVPDEDKGCGVTLDDLARMRENYTMAGLDEAQLDADWVTQFDQWLGQAVQGGVTEPNAMVLATATRAGVPSTRTVLAKAVDARGVVFYTNYTSSKSHDLDQNPWAAVTFPWFELQRQVHVRGRVHRVDEAESRTYWKTRPRSSQIGAWSSPQSTVVAGRDELDRLEGNIIEQFGQDQEVPLPPQWGGWRIEPVTVEFWQGRSGRMHDRLRYRLDERLGDERVGDERVGDERVGDERVGDERVGDERVGDERWVIERLAP